MEIIINKTYLEFTRKFRSEVKSYSKNPTLFIPPSFLKDELVGTINGKNFWLQRTIPRFFVLPSRRFLGIIEDCGDYIKIVGNFKMWLSNKLLILIPGIIYFMIFAIFLLPSLIRVVGLLGIILSMFIVIIAPLCFFIVTRITFKKIEERSVIDFLQNM